MKMICVKNAGAEYLNQSYICLSKLLPNIHVCFLYADCKEYLLNGKYHREDGPAHQGDDGVKYWYFHGQFHCIGGPALDEKNCKQWFIYDQLHREDGPAIEYEVFESGRVVKVKRWFINNQELSEEEFEQWRKDNGK